MERGSGFGGIYADEALDKAPSTKTNSFNVIIIRYSRLVRSGTEVVESYYSYVRVTRTGRGKHPLAQPLVSIGQHL